MSFVGDKGREIYFTFQWETVRIGSGESKLIVSEKDVLKKRRPKIQSTPRRQEEPA